MNIIYPFSPLLGANLCLNDEKRVKAFEKAIKETVKEGDTVLDIGAGTGILSLFALRNGARKVYAVEIDPYLSNRLEVIAEQNGVYNRVEVIKKNAMEIDSIDDSVDVVIMEMITTGLIEEAQIPVYHHLVERGLILPKTRVVPKSHETYAIPLEYDFAKYGFYFPRVEHIISKNFKRKLGGKKRLHLIEFKGHTINPQQNQTVEFTFDENGIFNAIGLMSRTKLSEHITLGETPWFNNSVAVPLDCPLSVQKESSVKIDFDYKMGYGLNNFKFKVFTGL